MNEQENAATVEAPNANVQVQSGIFAEDENLLIGLLAGAGTAVVCAILWAVITVVTGYQIGYMALGLGALVGLVMRFAGKGGSFKFGVLAGALSFLGCVLGNMLAAIGFVSSEDAIPYFELLSQVSFADLFTAVLSDIEPIDLLFYGLAIFFGFKMSFAR